MGTIVVSLNIVENKVTVYMSQPGSVFLMCPRFRGKQIKQMSGFLTKLGRGVKRELLDTNKARKLAYYGHTTRTPGSCLEKEIMQGTTPGARRRGRPRTAWMDNIKT